MTSSQRGFLGASIYAAVILGLIAFMSSCVGVTPEKNYIIACSTLDSVANEALFYYELGDITETAMQSIYPYVSTAYNVCTDPTAVNNPQAIATVNTAIDQVRLTLAEARHGQ